MTRRNYNPQALPASDQAADYPTKTARKSAGTLTDACGSGRPALTIEAAGEGRDYAAIADAYIERVLSGEELVCRKVRLAVERHVKDIARSEDPNYPYYYDPQGGVLFCRLFEHVLPSKWPSRMTMAPWQVAHDMLLYGWKQKADNLRRFRVAYDRWPRKTGKSARGSVQQLYHLKLDGERGAEVYSVALVEEQARRVFDEAVAMRDATPALRREVVKVGESPCKRLVTPKENGVCRPLSRDKESMEGLNVSFAIGDEVHKWPGRGAYDVIRYSMRSRPQPLFQLITTAPAADDTTSICNTLDDYADKVLTGAIDDARFFTWILELDGELKNAAGEVIEPADRWDDETKWVKACPNLGITVKLEDMRQEALEAGNDAGSLNAFKRYSLNIRVDAAEQAIPTADWDLCARVGDAIAMRAETLAKLKGRICFAALDLALTDDTSGLVLVFPPMEPTEKWVFIPHFWIPSDNIQARVEKHQVPYDVWRDQGFLTTTPGKVTDYDFIAARILELSTQFDLRELAYDPALATGLIKTLLQKGFKKERVVKFAQTMLNYAAPCGDFVRAIARREVEHDADPVLRWQITNLRWIKNHTGLFMPDKLKSIEKIDGVVAAIMAYGRANHPDNAKLLKPKAKVTLL
jgi:phage terminase large subunit-like protein